MHAEYLRDAAMTAAIFGFFTMNWFGWALEGPPVSWRRWLIGGLVLAGLTCAAGVVVAVLHWSDGTVFDPDTGRVFGIVVGVEFAVAGIGAAVLGVRRRAAWIPVWIAFVVGVHLFPVAAILHYPVIHVVAVLVTAASVVAIPVARRRGLLPSAVVGVGTGVPLVAGGVYSLVSAVVAF
ncbi:hypothetical protein [Actinoplanes awajinensis]|uniref:Uncharacterized protein n=1 Tax=Actinoplanes awajinensis subsp. mycoplanecinus TaxID=135947 RepID=A0A101JAY3_9ACTN|nr:hypothetical protein [Actinoplanes awajinensis]KUL23434.1 hypothetical protein ADL15_45465 [Actinoplanes awajinensis subsp. mycoplanecinus]